MVDSREAFESGDIAPALVVAGERGLIAVFAGFLAIEVGPNGRWRPTAKIGLLEGATGVALGLLAAATNVEPSWDRMMVVSVPPKRGPF